MNIYLDSLVGERSQLIGVPGRLSSESLGTVVKLGGGNTGDVCGGEDGEISEEGDIRAGVGGGPLPSLAGGRSSVGSKTVL